jgi:hypothetical protein
VTTPFKFFKSVSVRSQKDCRPTFMPGAKVHSSDETVHKDENALNLLSIYHAMA